TLGATTPSYDLETEVNKNSPTDHINDALIKETTGNFIGEIDQKPPLFSAIKKDGVRLYDLARKGESTEIKSRKITIFEFEITKIDMPNVDFRVVCSKGTYIRSLANDFGFSLNTGSHLSALRRTKSGNFDVNSGISPEEFVDNLFKD
ncbi:MAG: tRNA pseudouridine(55) synthase, partial [Bacteroidota bacterium]